jgi:hypothetical protein
MIIKLIRHIMYSEWDKVEEILPAGAKAPHIDDIDYTGLGKSALGWASFKGHVETVQALLVMGADVNKAGEDGNKPLIEAIEEQHWAVARLLLEYKAEVNIRCYSQTPLVKASFHGQIELVRILLARGANINLVDANADSPLITAIHFRHWDIVKLLLTHKPNVNHVSFDGETALTAAAFQGHLETVKELVAIGANINHLTKYSETALIKATRQNKWEVVNFLVSYPNAIPHPFNFYQVLKYHLGVSQPDPVLNLYAALIYGSAKSIQNSDKLNTLFIAFAALIGAMIEKEEKRPSFQKVELDEVHQHLKQLNLYEYEKAVYLSMSNDSKIVFCSNKNKHEQTREITKIIMEYLFIDPINQQSRPMEPILSADRSIEKDSKHAPCDLIVSKREKNHHSSQFFYIRRNHEPFSTNRKEKENPCVRLRRRCLIL